MNKKLFNVSAVMTKGVGMVKQILCVIAVLSLPAVGLAMPHDSCGEGVSKAADCASCHKLTAQEASILLKDVGEVKSIKVSAVKGLYEMNLENKGQRAIAYLDFAKKHLIRGPIFDIATKKPIAEMPNQQPPQPVAVNIDSVPTANSIILGNPQGKKKMFVFTDPECPFCSKLHWELVKLVYMEPDLTIYIKMYPLAMHPKAYDKARVILGNGTPYMLDKAFSGETLPAPGPKDPKEPVDATMKYAESIGINSTPTIIFPDGKIMPGFREAAALKGIISGQVK